MMMWNHGSSTGAWVLMILAMVSLWTLLVAGIIWLVRTDRRHVGRDLSRRPGDFRP